MTEQQVEITNRLGLHARAAAKLVHTANGYRSQIFIGTGETCIRGNILPGDGVYRSLDAGETWEHVGFRESHGISKIRIHPTNPDIIYVQQSGMGAQGKYGRFRTVGPIAKPCDVGGFGRADDSTSVVRGIGHRSQ